MLEYLQTVASIGKLVKEVLEDGVLRRFAALMHEHWEQKRARTGGMSSNAIDRWYEVGRASGALGGKLVGAGGGGVLMFYAEQPASLREAMAREGLAGLRFSLDPHGS